MCGIAGVFGKRDHEIVETMLTRLAHRGPDDENVVSTLDFSLGVRRLSIVDIAGGRQPVANETGTVWAAQNGEIYNYLPIRQQLMSKGHHLHSRCDTEILPHLYEEYGANLVEHIDGMFAIAIWDDNKKTGLLARDRVGKKPLYYYQADGVIYFASEIKALLTVPGFRREINFEALNHFLSYKHVPCPLSIFKGIALLPPAHMLLFRAGQEPQIQRYWNLDYSNNKQMADCNEEELTERLLQLLRQGLSRRLMADVPIGFFLSGGIDSSLSVALAAEMSSAPIKTFTLTYKDASTTNGKDQDRQWSKWIADKYATEHYEEQIEFTNFPENLRKIIGCFDEPFAGTMSTYWLANLISQHVKVAISGDGADELFGSYRSHRLAFPLSNYHQYIASRDPNLISPFESQTELLSKLYESEDWAWRSKLFVYTDSEKMTLLSPEIAASVAATSSREALRRDFATLTAGDPLNRILEVEFKTIFPDQVLTFVDRLSMVHSLEIRSAYLDTDLITFAAQLPGRLKIHKGQTKYLLKKAALKYLPEEMVFRKKEGFLMPIAQWLVNDLENYVRETLSPRRLSQHNIFNNDYIQLLINQFYDHEFIHNGFDYMYANKLLTLVTFQEWHELYLG